MRYLLITAAKYPDFYNVNGEVVNIELYYVNSKTISSIDDDGELTHQEVRSERATGKADLTYWMVDSIEESLHKLETEGIFPFQTKKGAAAHAKRLGLTNHRYLAIN